MKLQIISDLHLDAYPEYGAGIRRDIPVADCDALVIAGDICNYNAELLKVSLQDFCERWPKVLYVPGNHEYWGSTPNQLYRNLRRLQDRYHNLDVLLSDYQTIGGQRIYGDTLWYGANLETLDRRKQAMMGDFYNIQEFESWVYERNAYTRQHLLVGSIPKDVVITHHLPTRQSISVKYARSPLNCYFCDPVLEVMTCTPKLWIHGHTHGHLDYLHQSRYPGNEPTRVVCNPLGTPGEDAGFIPDFVVEIND